MTAALLAPGATRALDPTWEALVMLGPAGDLKAQIRYLTTTWPDQHAIAVVTAAGAGRCDTGTTDRVYCTQRVRLAESVLIRWLETDPQAPGDGFAIHYWFDAGRSAIEIAPGELLLVFLAPTHAQGTYACTVLTRATDAVVRDVREALRTLEGR